MKAPEIYGGLVAMDQVADFGVLGPLSVRVGSSAVTVSSPRLRILLAALLLNAGRLVATRELVHIIWGYTQPENPRRALHVCVARLRSQLAQHVGDGLIATEVDGYRIDVPPSQLDVARFASRIEEADRAAARADVAAEAAAVAAALREWRGEPLADVPSEALHKQEGGRLREAHLQALERHFDIKLRLGDDGDLIADLLALTSRHPDRERLWVQLLTALHAAGRRVEALDAYHTVRRRLAGEFGLDPSPELQNLHAAILHGRDDIAARPVAAAGPGVQPPRQLPPGVQGFTGRAAEIARLDELVADRPQANAPVIALVSGVAGGGKSSLAAWWSRRVVDHFPDGQLWLDLHGNDTDRPVTPEQALTRFLRALGVPGRTIPLDVSDQVGLWRTMVDGRRMLIVLDNAESAEQVRPLLPGAPHSFALVTSRHQLTSLVAVDGAHPLHLDPLGQDEARHLLTHRLGIDRVANEPAAVDTIIDISAGLPLALAIVAARAATCHRFDLAAAATELRASHERDVIAGPAETIDIRATFFWSYEALSQRAATMLRYLSLHPGPDITMPAAASLMGTSTADVRPALAELCDAHLLTERTPGRYGLHDLVRRFTGERARSGESPAARRAVTIRMLDHYLVAAQSAAALLGPQPDAAVQARPHTGVSTQAFGDHREAMAWFTAEHNVLLTIITTMGRYPTYIGHLAAAMSEYLARRGFWRDWIDVQQVALDAAVNDRDPVAQARAHRGLARAFYRLRQLRTAATHCRLALTICEQLGDRAGQAHCHLGLGAIAQRQRHKRKALGHTRTALDLFTEIDERTWMARSLDFVGWSYFQLGDDEQAVACCQRALALGQENGDRYYQACTLDSLGRMYHHLGRHADAAACFHRSIDLHRDFGDRVHEGLVLSRLGDALQSAGHHGPAQEAWQDASVILTELGHPHAHEVDQRLTEHEAPRR